MTNLNNIDEFRDDFNECGKNVNEAFVLLQTNAKTKMQSFLIKYFIFKFSKLMENNEIKINGEEFKKLTHLVDEMTKNATMIQIINERTDKND